MYAEWHCYTQNVLTIDFHETDLGVIWSLRHSYIVKLCSRRVWKLIISYRYEVAVSSNMWILKSYELHRDSQWKCETHLHKQPWFDKIHSVPCSTLCPSLISSFQSYLALQFQVDGFICLVWLYAVCWVLVPPLWQVQDARSVLRPLISLAY